MREGRIRELDRIGNNLGDEAADFGRRRGHGCQEDLCLRLWDLVSSGAGPAPFFTAKARVIVNDDGKRGDALNPLVWCSGAPAKQRRVVKAVPDFVVLPGPHRLWLGGWQLAEPLKAVHSLEVLGYIGPEVTARCMER